MLSVGKKINITIMFTSNIRAERYFFCLNLYLNLRAYQ